MEALKKAIENRSSPLEVGSKTPHRGRVVSFRVSEKLIKLLEMQRASWGMSLSDTVRHIVEFYFLPTLAQEAMSMKVQEFEELNERELSGSRTGNLSTIVDKLVTTEAASIKGKAGALEAQRAEPVLFDAKEAEEYARFLFELNEQNMKHYQVIREEALAMQEIASKKLLEQARDLEQAKLPNIEEVQRV
jgi:hypothetical protein